MSPRQALGLKPKRPKQVAPPALDRNDMDKLFGKGDQEGPGGGGPGGEEERIQGLGYAGG